MEDSQKKGDKFLSGGRRIDDMSFWAGGPGKDMVMPQGVHTKNESSAEGAGEVMKYLDKTEAIKEAQVHSVKQVRKYPMRQPGYRN